MPRCFCNDFASYKQKMVARDHQAVVLPQLHVCLSHTVFASTSVLALHDFVDAGIKRVLVPKRNWRDVKADVPDNIRSSLEIIPCTSHRAMVLSLY
ncbi:MAG: hypothetical protein FRX49_05733 [Trebouxia sp. A1-2]|nr:MAG: hypothetical protein FRX49_05733 [Trebouxia sp. A1-2]